MKTWADGVADSIRIVEYRRRMLTMYDGCGDPGVGIKSRPSAVAMLDEVLVFLRAMLERGSYEDRSLVWDGTMRCTACGFYGSTSICPRAVCGGRAVPSMEWEPTP